MLNSIFKIIYLLELLLATGLRKFYTARISKADLKVQSRSRIEVFLMLLNAVGLVIPLVYIFSTVLDFADYAFPDWIAWAGVGLFAGAIGLLWKAHYDLGQNWIIAVALRHRHELITHGIYKYLRHPMYSAHLLWALAQIMILHNWIAGYSFLIVQIPFYWYRIRKEEKMMVEHYGETYKSYMQKTNMLIPGLL